MTRLLRPLLPRAAGAGEASATCAGSGSFELRRLGIRFQGGGQGAGPAGGAGGGAGRRDVLSGAAHVAPQRASRSSPPGLGGPREGRKVAASVSCPPPPVGDERCERLVWA